MNLFFEGEGFLPGFSFLGAPQEARLHLVALAEVLLLVRVELIVLQALVGHVVIVLAVVCHHLALLGVVVVQLAPCPLQLVLGDEVVQTLGGGLANCAMHAIDFLKLDDLDGCLSELNNVMEGLHRKWYLKSVKLSGVILMKKRWKKHDSPSWSGPLQFVRIAWRQGSLSFLLRIVASWWRVVRCGRPKLYSFDGKLVEC